MTSAPCRLRLDGAALADNWRALDAMSGSATCGAAVKADGYGLGARDVATRLAAAGCRDFYVATWNEAAELADLALPVAVLHGVREEDMALATTLPHARPVLNTPAQVARWREKGGGPCDLMVDTGINRLGIAPNEVAGLSEGLALDTLMSHLARADEGSAMNEAQRRRFATLAGTTGARRMSLANSAGIALGEDYRFDLVRPGLALYGGVPRDELAHRIRPAVTIEAELLQCRMVPEGETVGYNATWTAPADTPVGIANLGYADGYRRAFSGRGLAWAGQAPLPVIGRVSMDLLALDLSAAPDLGEGDWIAIDPDLPAAAIASGVSQYELLTGLGRRFDRVWVG